MIKKTGSAPIWRIIVLLAVALCACKTEKLTPPAYVPPSTPVPVPSAVIVSFTAVGTITPAINSIANAGQADVHATVTDSAGSGVSGVSVNFSVTGGAANGTLSSPSATTDASGVATVTLTAVITNAPVSVTASANAPTGVITNTGSITVGTISTLPSSVTVTFTAVGTTTPTVTSITDPGAVPNMGQADVHALVTDSLNNVLAGVTVNFSVQNGAATGTFSAASATTNAAGIATVTYTSVLSGAFETITASVASGATTVNNSAVLKVGSPPPPTPATLTFTINPLTINITGQTLITVTVKDVAGNPAYSAPINLAITAGAALGSFSFTDPLADTISGLTDSGGVYVATFYAGTTSGLVTIQATVAPISPKSQSLVITSEPSSIDLQAASTSLTVSQQTQLQADVRNVMNAAVPDGTMVTFSIVTGVGSISPTTAPTISGLATVTFTADKSQIGPVFVQATAGATSPVTSSLVLISVSQAGTGSITFDSATPSTITVQGASPTSSLVKFIVKDINGVVKQGVNVNFTLFGPTGATITPLNALSDASGVVTTTLKSGNVAGPARIVATDPLAGLSTSGTVAIGGGVPAYNHFDISASRINLEGFNCNGIQTTFTAYVADRFGNFNIPKNTVVSFTTEAGAIDTSGLTDSTGKTTVTLRTQAPLPMDVAPVAGEPSYAFGGHTYNPRDGWVTVMVSTTGEESFLDENADGIFTVSLDTTACPAGYSCECNGGAGTTITPSDVVRTCAAGNRSEGFIDLGEPYIDVDDNRIRTAGEQFFDWPPGVTPQAPNPAEPNNVYDAPNGVWDAQIPIFKFYTLVFTSAPSIGDTAAGILTSRIECVDPLCATPTDNITMLGGASRAFKVYVSDINMNTLMPGSSIAVVASPKGSVSVAQAPTTNTYTIGDGLSFGPTVLDVVLTNNLVGGTNPDPNTFVNLKAQITWPGGCVSPALTTGVLYPGTIFMTHP